MRDQQSVLVVGGGVVGLSTAQALLQTGYQVTVVEKTATGQESSWAGGGILSPLCPWDYSAAVTQLTNRSAILYAGWVKSLHEVTGINPEYQVNGMLILPPFDLDQAQHWCVGHGMRAEEKNGGLLLPDVAQVRNPRLLQALRIRVKQLGGRIVEHCEVQAVKGDTGRVQHLLTSQGIFKAEHYIVTAGAWSSKVLGEYALQLDIKPIRGQMLLFKFDTPPLQHIVLKDGMYLIPRRDGHLLVGSTLEDVGFDKSTTAEARDSLWQRASLLLPALRDMPLVRHWSGLRPASPNNIPTIGRHPKLENLYVNSGHFRYGVTMAPASAEILMNELNGVEQPFDVTSYAMKV